MDGIPDFEEVFKLTKMYLKLIGVPFHSSKINTRFYILLFCLTVTVLQEMGYFIIEASAENFLTLTQLAPCTFCGLFSSLKIVALVLNKDKVFKLTDCLKNSYQDILKDIKNVNDVRKNFVFLKYLIKYYYILNAVLLFVYCFSNIFLILYQYMETKEVIYILPFPVYVPFPIDSFAIWLPIYLHCVLSASVCSLYYATGDALYYIMTTHISSHFRVISDEIMRLDGENTCDLNNILKRHQYILNLSEDLEEIFTAINFFNVFGGTLEICALGFNLTMGKLSHIPRVAVYLSTVLLQMFMMSAFGEKVFRESMRVGEAAFLCKWYDMDQRSQKSILQLIQRSSKPQMLTAYKFSTISYESFIKIISRSWSYFTLLKTVYKPPEGIQA